MIGELCKSALCVCLCDYSASVAAYIPKIKWTKWVAEALFDMALDHYLFLIN